MELLDVIHARRSVRAFQSDPLPRETLQHLLDIAVQAPTGMNAQPWAFGVIEGAERLKEYSDSSKAFLLEHMHQFPGFERYRGLLADPDSNLCHNAPACIVVYAKPGGPTAENDCTMAAYNIMLAAQNLGLGTCWVGFLGFILNSPEQKHALGVPEEYRALAPIVVGRPLGDIPPVQKAAPEVLYWKE